MALRNAKQTSILTVLKRKLPEEHLDKLIPIQGDGFTDGDKGNIDYKASPKKVKKNTVKRRNAKINENLSPHQRIKRLKDRIASKQLITSQNESKDSNVDAAELKRSNESRSAIQTGSNLIEKQCKSKGPIFIETYDEFFVEEDGGLVLVDERNDSKIIETDISQQISSGSFALTLDKNDANVNNRDKSNDNVQNSISIMQKFLNESSDIRSMLISLIAKYDDMNGEILALRRQVARIEAKSTSIQNLNNAHSSFKLNESVFLDFESTLVAEGLPIKSIEGVSALEQRLKETAYSTMPYRQKLV